MPHAASTVGTFLFFRLQMAVIDVLFSYDTQSELSAGGLDHLLD